MWVLGTGCWSSTTAGCALNCWVLFQHQAGGLKIFIVAVDGGCGGGDVCVHMRAHTGACVWFPEDTHSTVSSRIELGSLSDWCKQTVSSAEPSFWPRQVDFKILIPLYWRESLHLYLGHMVWRGGVISSYLYLPGYRSWSGGKFLIHTDNWTF